MYVCFNIYKKKCTQREANLQFSDYEPIALLLFFFKKCLSFVYSKIFGYKRHNKNHTIFEL